MSKQKKISNFFNNVKVLPEIQSNESESRSNEPDHRVFYKSCLNEQNQCQNEFCINKKNELEQKKEEVLKKIKKNEDAIKICANILSRKEEEIKKLHQDVERLEIKEKIVLATGAILNTNTNENCMESFSTFGNNFTAEELSQLRSIGLSSREDSTFVASCLKFAYKENISILKTKSVTGKTTKSSQTKEPVSPKKMEMFSKIFTERVNLITNDATEREARVKRFNKYIKDAINNINKSTQSKEIEKNACKMLQSVAINEGKK